MALTTLSNQSITITTDELDALETKVRNGLGSFREVGNALIEIRDRGGFKRRGYKTFEEYCDREFGETDRQARRLINSAVTAGKVEKILGLAPRNEAVARELEKIADDPAVLEKVARKLDSGRKPLTVATATAERVKEVVANVTGKVFPPKPTSSGSAAPKPGSSKPVAAAPAVGSGDVATLQAVFTRARSFLSTHPWLKDNADAKAVITDIDTGLVLLDKLLANSYSHLAARPGAKDGKETGGPPLCPHCGEPVKPGETFCGKCGTVLE